MKDVSKPVLALIDSMDASGWSLNDERQLHENLYAARFNFFLVVFSLFVTAGFANNFEVLKSLVFFAGGFVLFLLWLPLNRAYRKLDRILVIIFNHKPDHVTSQIDRILVEEGFERRFAVTRMMGFYIPWVCILLMLAAGCAVAIGLLE